MNLKDKYLVTINFLLVLILLILSNLGFLPFGSFVVFGVVCLLTFIFTWFQLKESFLFFSGFIVLENIGIAPINLGFNIRLYQLFAGVIFLTLFLKFVFKKLEINLSKFYWKDGLILIFVLGSFLSAIFSENQSVALKQTIIITSFSLIYFLFRVFVQDLKELKKTTYFFLSSSLGVVIYGIWQNWQFVQGGNHFEIMPGRPNGTFSEPDWLGMFLVFLIAVLYVLIFKRLDSLKKLFKDRLSLFYLFFLTLTYVLLILTVVRSAWLGAGMVTVIYLILTLLNLNNGWKNFYRKLNWKLFFSLSSIISISIIFSVCLVNLFNLTNFELGNRVQSTGSGKQEITIACIPNYSLEQDNFIKFQKEIKDVSELKKYNCRHINLEEIESEKGKGNFITKIYRDDPNVNVRSEVYKKSWNVIKDNWFLGIGWGNIGNVLGTDEAGTVLNSSNVFLEIWLGAGFLGTISFVIFVSITFWQGLNCIFNKSEFENKLWGIFIVLGLVAILIPNMFNAGIMLGFLWMFFGVSCLSLK